MSGLGTTNGRAAGARDASRAPGTSYFLFFKLSIVIMYARCHVNTNTFAFDINQPPSHLDALKRDSCSISSSRGSRHDTSRALVCFFFINFLYYLFFNTLMIILGYSMPTNGDDGGGYQWPPPQPSHLDASKWQQQQQREQEQQHDHEQQLGLETRHVSSPWYVFFLFPFLLY